MKSVKKRKAFTLAEVIIVISILGVIAALTIPATVNKTITRANKTKIKKALSNYERVVNEIYTEQNLPRTVTALDSWANNDGNCTNIKNKFHAVESDGCKIKTSDGLWWDFGTYSETNDLRFSKTIIAFKKDNLNPEDAVSSEFKAFILVTDIDRKGTIRINDASYQKEAYQIPDEEGNLGTYGSRFNIQATTKVQAYLNDQIYKLQGKTREIVCRTCTRKSLSGTSVYEKQYDADGNLIYEKTKDIDGNIFESRYKYDKDGYVISAYRTKNGIYASSTDQIYDMYGNIISYDYKDSNGKYNHSYTVDYKYDEYGRVLVQDTKESNGNETILTYARDNKGKVTYYNNKQEYSNGNSYEQSIDYLTNTRETQSTGTNTITDPKNPYSYEYTNKTKSQNNIEEDWDTYKYDDGRITEVYWKYDSKTGADYEWTQKTTNKEGNLIEDWSSTTRHENGYTINDYGDKITGSSGYEKYDSKGNYIGGEETNYKFNSNGEKVKTSYSYSNYEKDSKGNNNGSSESHTWDLNGNETQNSSSSQNYTYDSNGGTYTFNYSSNNFEKGTNSISAREEKFNNDGKQTYYSSTSAGRAADKNGNLYDYDNKYTTSYTYDNKGRQTGIAKTTYETKNGRITSNYTETTTYTYDENGNKNSVVYCKNNVCKENRI